jgi:GNAT superfamily N-acetyltransferase
MKNYERKQVNDMKATETHQIIALREHPEYQAQAVAYFSQAFGIPQQVYDDSMTHSLTTPNPLPQWYVMLKGERLIGCYGLITNDFNSRQDLWPWLAALFISPDERGQGLGKVLLDHGIAEASKLGYPQVYLVTDHTTYYEKYGWEYIGTAYGVDGESRLYSHDTSSFDNRGETYET